MARAYVGRCTCGGPAPDFSNIFFFPSGSSTISEPSYRNFFLYILTFHKIIAEQQRPFPSVPAEQAYRAHCCTAPHNGRETLPVRDGRRRLQPAVGAVGPGEEETQKADQEAQRERRVGELDQEANPNDRAAVQSGNG